MGWWGKGVMEGDEPSDVSSFFHEAVQSICNISEEAMDQLDEMADTNHPDYEKTRLALVATMNAIMQDPKKLDRAIDDVMNSVEVCHYEGGIAYQVFGVIIMRNGWPMSKHLKHNIISAAHFDGWAYEDEERKAKMRELIRAVNAYDGKTPTEITSRGLLEMVQIKLSQGHRGLINTGPTYAKSHYKQPQVVIKKNRRSHKPWL